MQPDNSPEHPADSFVRAALEQLKNNDVEGAIENFGKAIALEPQEALHYSNRGRLLFALGRAEESLADYSKAIELAPEATLYSSRSVIYVALGRSAAALFDLNDAYELDPSVTNLLNRAAFYTNRGMAEDALRDMDKVIELEPENSEYRLNRANLAFALLGHNPEYYYLGYSDIKKAIELDTTGEIRESLEKLADQLESNLQDSPNPELSQQLINLIRRK